MVATEHRPVRPPPAAFNRAEVFAVGWYWVVASHELPRRGVQRATVQGRDVVVWRGDDGIAHVIDAYCPHMGAHLGDGRVEADGLRCFFHAWKFGADGACVDIPCMARPVSARVRAWPTAERYGLIWVWTGESPTHGLPAVPDLGDADPGDALVADTFVKACHPNVVMINAIDAQHFNSVHNLPAELHMACTEVSPQSLDFQNTVPPRADTWFGRLLRKFYSGPITYGLRYWFGSTGCVTVGPDLAHFHILFALRMGAGGKTEGRTVLITRHRPGPLGWVVSRVALGLSWVVGTYFAQGDTKVFETIRFDFQTPIKADHAIVHFIQHFERQPHARWQTWEPVPVDAAVAEPA
jgi:phenylpropionate dioxygenase-like ring-hydroxylating dioxygenase large terminal subunit